MQASFFTQNRKRLLKKLKPSSLVVLTAFTSMQRDVDQAFEFQQESNFWYLTGIEEPDWLLVIDADTGDEWLISPQLNRYQKNFLGGLTPDRATSVSGVPKVLEQREGMIFLNKLRANKKQVYTVVPESLRVYKFQPNPAPRKLVTKLKGSKIEDVRPIIAKLRAIKGPEELEMIQRAVDITIDGLAAVYAELKNYTHENEIDAKLYYEFRRRGAVHGFDPIIASGQKTCVLHSPAMNDPLGHSLLLDVGARVSNYTADITRTIPIGTPSDRWLQVYEAVVRMHDHFLALLTPGASVKDVIMKNAYPFVGEEMRKLGLVDKVKLDHTSVFKFMPHAIAHGLGIDTHDPLGRPETFEEGMVLTDEVGVYIPDEGFGVRIENDIVITKDGARNMAAKLPITLPELQKMLQ
ncbi:MAG TPA: Xaa-Pro peptidase family protein [Candidatus Saccharimonadales bacterium]|nr:Xaa-Pro peptidase family protein [Candidatus Saccharimonadales bacterium]